MVQRVKLLSDPTKRKIPEGFRNPNGRPVGSKNASTKIMENLVKLRKKGELPHEFLLRVVRGERIAQGKPKEDGRANYEYPDLELRIKCAIAAAPYFAPRLSTIEVIKNLTDDNLDSIIRAAAEGAGVLLDFKQEIGENGEVTYVDNPDQEEDEVDEEFE